MPDALTMRSRILELEDVMAGMEQAQLDLFHHFTDELYARELRIPAGCVLTGKIHRHESLNILAQGRISVATEHGTVEYEAPAVIVSPPGVKRAGYAITDCTWITVHHVQKGEARPIEDVEAELVCDTFEELEGPQCHSLPRRS